MAPPINRPEDVWERVDVRGPDECWPWTAGRNHQGYGRMRVFYRAIAAHRLAFMVSTGSDPGDLAVLHTCDNPPCCNPAHLFLGTLADNNRDRAAKGRSCRGEEQKDAKLTADAVRAIRARSRAGEQGKDLAADFGVSRSAISLILRGRTWRHV
jgi:hypothetical protein